MALDRAKADDQIFVKNGVKILVDANSAMYLEGSEVDYVDTAMGSGFKIQNPNAEASSCGESGGSCGCGSKN